MHFPTYYIGGLLAVLAWHSHAQSPRPDPSGTAAVPPVTYQSPLQSYRAFQPQTPDDWREANDTVGRIGGWQAYAAEVWEASQSEELATKDNTDSAADAHQHH